MSKIKILISLALSTWLPLYPYRKFRHITLPRTESLHAPFNLNHASYTLIDTTGTVTSYIHLNGSDRERIYRSLKHYGRSTNVTPEFIKQFASSARSRKNIVGLVLQDFTTMKQDVTIGSILDSLGKNKGTHK